QQERARGQWRREADEHAQRAARTRTLTAHGQVYLAQALAEVDDLSPMERFALTWKVERALAAGVASARAEDDVERLGGHVVAGEGGIVVDDDGDDDRDEDEDEDDEEDAYEDEEE